MLLSACHYRYLVLCMHTFYQEPPPLDSILTTLQCLPRTPIKRKRAGFVPTSHRGGAKPEWGHGPRPTGRCILRVRRKSPVLRRGDAVSLRCTTGRESHACCRGASASSVTRAAAAGCGSVSTGKCEAFKPQTLRLEP